MCAGSPDGGLYIAFNTSHRPAVVDLPQWAGRRWQLYADSGKVLQLDLGWSVASLAECLVQKLPSCSSCSGSASKHNLMHACVRCSGAPYDCLVADEALSAGALAQARADAATWTDEHVYALLPYSFCVLESLTMEQVARWVTGHDAMKRHHLPEYTAAVVHSCNCNSDLELYFDDVMERKPSVWCTSHGVRVHLQLEEQQAAATGASPDRQQVPSAKRATAESPAARPADSSPVSGHAHLAQRQPGGVRNVTLCYIVAHLGLDDLKLPKDASSCAMQAKVAPAA